FIYLPNFPLLSSHSLLFNFIIPPFPLRSLINVVPVVEEKSSSHHHRAYTEGFIDPASVESQLKKDEQLATTLYRYPKLTTSWF
ncbi:hypothetical protein M8C21_003665, partial [Ambrosia artemisiifolia]